MKSILVLTGPIFLMTLLLFACTSPSPPVASTTHPPPTVSSPSVTAVPASGESITGIVLDSQGVPVPKATVRIQATTNETTTDEQ